MEIVFCCTGKDPRFVRDLAEAERTDRWCIGLNTGLILITPRVLWGMEIRRDVSLAEARKVARILLGKGDRWLVYRWLSPSKASHVSCVQVKYACSQAEEIHPSLYTTRELAEYYADRWRKAVDYWGEVIRR